MGNYKIFIIFTIKKNAWKCTSLDEASVSKNP